MYRVHSQFHLLMAFSESSQYFFCFVSWLFCSWTEVYEYSAVMLHTPGAATLETMLSRIHFMLALQEIRGTEGRWQLLSPGALCRSMWWWIDEGCLWVSWSVLAPFFPLHSSSFWLLVQNVGQRLAVNMKCLTFPVHKHKLLHRRLFLSEMSHAHGHK